MTARFSTRIVCTASALLVSATTLMAQPTIDGRNIPTEFAGPDTTVVQQRIQTQFGNCDGGFFCGGSELNRMFLTNDDDNLYIGLTGNLENNGNCIVMFIDVDGTAGGAQVLKTRTVTPPFFLPELPRYLTGNPDAPFAPFALGLHNLPFDTGFAPDFALGLSGGSPRGSQTRTYYLANWTTLAPDANNPANLSNEVLGTITTGDENAAGPAGTLGSFQQTSALGVLGAADNSNADGVGGGTTAIDCNVPLSDDPNDATFGFEFAIPLSIMGVQPGDDVCVLALVSSPDGFLSNQLLPPPALGPGSCSLSNLGPIPGQGGSDPVDLNDLLGDQFLCHTLTGGAACGSGCEVAGGCADLNGDGAVDLSDLAIVLANFGTTGGATPATGDTNGDGNTDLTDLANVLALFGTSCP